MNDRQIVLKAALLSLIPILIITTVFVKQSLDNQADIAYRSSVEMLSESSYSTWKIMSVSVKEQTESVGEIWSTYKIYTVAYETPYGTSTVTLHDGRNRLIVKNDGFKLLEETKINYYYIDMDGNKQYCIPGTSGNVRVVIDVDSPGYVWDYWVIHT